MSSNRETDSAYLIDVGYQKLSFDSNSICFAGSCLELDKIEGLQVVRTDTYVKGVWVSGVRRIILRAGKKVLHIDCSRLFPNRSKLDRGFLSVMMPVREFVGVPIINKILGRLVENKTCNVAGINIQRNGVWLAGSWKFLWWQAEPRFVPWDDLKIWISEGVLYLESKKDLRCGSEIIMNKTENALILDQLVRLLFEGNNLTKFKNWQPTAPTSTQEP